MDDSTGSRTHKILIDVLNLRISPEELAAHTSLYSPVLQFDSLALLQFLIAIEEEFGITIEDEDVMAADLRNVGDLLELVRQHVVADEAVPE